MRVIVLFNILMVFFVCFCVLGKSGASTYFRAEEGGSVVSQQTAQACRGFSSKVPLGLLAGGDAVDGSRLRSGEKMEGGCC